MEDNMSSTVNKNRKSSKPKSQEDEEEEDEPSSLEEVGDSDTLSLSDLPLQHQLDQTPKYCPSSNPSSPFNNHENTFFEFFSARSPNPNPQKIDSTSSWEAGEAVIFFGNAIVNPNPTHYNKDQEQEEEGGGGGEAPSPVRKSSPNPFEDEEDEVAPEEYCQRNPNPGDVLLPLSSARLLNELIHYRSSTRTTPPPPTRPSSRNFQNQSFLDEERLPRGGHPAGGACSSSPTRKKHKVLLGLVKLAPKVEQAGHHKKNRQIKNQGGQSEAPLFRAVAADDGGRLPWGGGCGGGRSRAYVGALKCRSRLSNVLAKASFGCIRLP